MTPIRSRVRNSDGSVALSEEGKLPLIVPRGGNLAAASASYFSAVVPETPEPSPSDLAARIDAKADKTALSTTNEAVASKADIAALAAVAESIPTPASDTPPAVDTEGAPGSAARFARADHTHKTSVQAAVVTTGADGTVEWVYPTPYPAGVSPVISHGVVGAAGNADLYSVQYDGAPTATKVKVRVNRATRSTVAAIASVFRSDPGVSGIQVHLIARKPTL